MAKCRACGKPITFIRMRSGRAMPCDPGLVEYWEAPGVSGKIITPKGEVLSCYYSGERGKSTGVGYKPHGGSCPSAEKFKERRARA